MTMYTQRFSEDGWDSPEELALMPIARARTPASIAAFSRAFFAQGDEEDFGEEEEDDFDEIEEEFDEEEEDDFDDFDEDDDDDEDDDFDDYDDDDEDDDFDDDE
jgi:hypothetical protein